MKEVERAAMAQKHQEYLRRNLAQAEIETLLNIKYENINLADYAAPVNVVLDRGLTQATNDDINGVMTRNLTAINEGYKVIVTVVWTDVRGPMTEIVEGIIPNYQ